MRIDLSPHVRDGAVLRLRLSRLVDGLGVGVYAEPPVGFDRAGRPLDGRSPIGTVTAVRVVDEATLEVDVAWDAGVDPSPWSQRLEYGHLVDDDVADLSEVPGLREPAEWRLVCLVVMTPQQADAEAAARRRALQ